eukprot:g29781.t1
MFCEAVTQSTLHLEGIFGPFDTEEGGDKWAGVTSLAVAGEVALVQTLPMFIRDSSDTLCHFQNFQFAGSSDLLFTMDMQSLYMSVPHQDGLRALHFFLEQRPDQSPPTTTILCLAEISLILNNISFNSSYFLQVRGVAMGTYMGPSYACLFMGYVEHSLFQSYSGPH